MNFDAQKTHEVMAGDSDMHLTSTSMIFVFKTQRHKHQKLAHGKHINHRFILYTKIMNVLLDHKP